MSARQSLSDAGEEVGRSVAFNRGSIGDHCRREHSHEMTSPFLPCLPIEKIRNALAKAPGNELDSGKILSPESSAALAANTFGLFLDRPLELPAIPGTELFGWPAKFVDIEHCARFPWSGGRHPWLDAFVETSTHIIGIESKRYEPFRSRQTGKLSQAYRRPIWGKRMGPYERMRDQIASGEQSFKHLDGVQLLKHAFGLQTEAQRKNNSPVLVYLYAEPAEWPDGRSIASSSLNLHAREASDFARRVEGAEVVFRTCTYANLLETFLRSASADVRKHGRTIREKFTP